MIATLSVTFADSGAGPPITSGLVFFGSIVPKPAVVPAMNGIGQAANFPPGPDSVTGFDRAGKKLFVKTFSDKIYDFYVFVPLSAATIEATTRLHFRLAKHDVDVRATQHGAAIARASALADGRVRVTWNADQFPRLACVDTQNGSPAPLMQGGDFTAADIHGNVVLCDFSDGVKTVARSVRVPIEGR